VTEREYGDRAGIWRLLDLFQRYQLKVTFLMNGLKVEQFPDIVKEIQAQGHKFSSEGYVHEYSFMYTKDEERESIQRTIRAFETVLGERPYGYLSPVHCHTDNTLELAADAGYVWWADPLNDDVPYTVSAKGRNLVVIPYSGMSRLLHLRYSADPQGSSADMEGSIRLSLYGKEEGFPQVLFD
jgi:peptidoglycan/xylan/chitin deacetylase (PgdA/CDA1 family)